MITIKTQPYVGQRIAATIIDYFIIFAFFIGFVFTFGEPDENNEVVVSGPLAIIPELFWFCWLVIPEAIWSKTLGHYIVGLKIITTEGNKPLFWQALVRRIFDIVDITCVFGLVAFILVQTSRHNQRVGDMLSKTLVVDKNYQMNETFDFENSTGNQ